MRDAVIQLNQFPFWLAAAVGILLLAPVTSAAPRKWMAAALNVGFLVVLLRSQSLALGLGLVGAYLLLQLVGRTERPGIVAGAIGLGMTGLFILHKMPPLADRYELGTLGRTLAFIGYSYVALRMCEVIRAVYEKRHPAPDLASTVNYLVPFHMLAAGPIQSYDEFVQRSAVTPAPAGRDVLRGVERIAAGLFKKFVLALIVQKLLLTDFQAQGAYLLLEVQVFFLWLYLDFSAYSDIAVGVGTLLGVATPENFNRPLLARNMIVFWERWHISLSMFVRRNLFIPLQMFFMRRDGGRSPLLCAIGATVISFLLCGLWHGLTLGFLIWGLAQAFGLVVARLYGYALQKRLGTKGVQLYLANPWIRTAAVLVTFEFEAFTLLTLFIS